MTTLNMTKKLAGLSMAMMLLACAAFAGPNRMTTWNFRTGGFSLAMPGQPEYKPLDNLQAWNLKDNGHYYQVTYEDKTSVDLAAEARGFATGFKGRITKEGYYTINGHPAHYAFGESATGKFFYYNTVVGNRIFHWAVSSDLNVPVTDEVQEFVDSFRLMQ